MSEPTAVIEQLDEAHMFACDVASNSIEAEKTGAIGAAIRAARQQLIEAQQRIQALEEEIRDLSAYVQGADCWYGGSCRLGIIEDKLRALFLQRERHGQ
jgi:hypothetical protein